MRDKKTAAKMDKVSGRRARPSTEDGDSWVSVADVASTLGSSTLHARMLIDACELGKVMSDEDGMSLVQRTAVEAGLTKRPEICAGEQSPS